MEVIPEKVLLRGRARARHLHFVKYCWRRPNPFIEAKSVPFQIAICDKIDAAFKRYREGISSFICINLCFGHGKSDLSSRYLPPHFLGEFPNDEVMVFSHTDDKANEFGQFSRDLVETDNYQQLYPGMALDASNHGVQEWALAEHFGKAQFIGIGAGTAGKRGNLIVIDDFFGKREHAESKGLRDKVWQAFTDDVMTRRAPVTIVLMVVTPWHVDDPVARLKKHMAKDPEFPQFEFLSFPAESASYPSGWLFPERFSEAWYGTQKKFLGNYGYYSLMQCDPKVRSGNFIPIDKVQIVDEMPEGLVWVRGYDLASSVKETQKQDPDWTVGFKLAITTEATDIEGVNFVSIYIDDVKRGQWEATERNDVIIRTAAEDGPIPVGIEAFGAYKDAYTAISKILNGIRSVIKMQLEGDKIAKASPLVPIFEAGRVYMRRARWNDAVLDVLRDFPGGAHDDDVDAMAVAYNLALQYEGCLIYTSSQRLRDEEEYAKNS